MAVKKLGWVLLEVSLETLRMSAVRLRRWRGEGWQEPQLVRPRI